MKGPLVLAMALPLLADVDPKAPPAVAKPWSDKAGLSFVSTSGNAEASTLGLSNELIYKWQRAQLQFNVAAVRINTTSVTRSATGSSLSDYAIREVKSTATTSESYLANLRYDHRISERFFWFVATGWERNIPTGLEGRLKGSGGLGRLWIAEPRTKFNTDLGLGYTHESPVFRPVGFKSSFGTWNLNAKLEQKIGASSGYASEMAFTDSLYEGKDYMAVWKNALSSSLNSHFALKVGLDLNYRNSPASVGIDLVQAGSEPPVVLGKVPFLLKKLDTVFTTSLVLTF